MRSTAVIERTWHDIYYLRALRNGAGATAWLFRNFGEPWCLYHSPDRAEGATCGSLVHIFTDEELLPPQQRPADEDVARHMSEGSQRFRGEETTAAPSLW